MKLSKLIFLLVFFSSVFAKAQNLEKLERIANQQLRDGNELYLKNSFADAEVSYKKSVATYPGNPKAIFNLANSIKQQKRYKEAIKHYTYLAKSSKSNSMRAKSFHNIGNAFMGLKDLQKAIDAYKNSLRINPKDEETRYNLAYAQKLLRQQKDKDDKKDNKEKDKDKKGDEKDKKDDKDKDKKDKDKKGDEKDKKDDKDKDKKNKEKDADKDKKNEPKNPEKDKEANDKKKPQPRPGKLTDQQAEQLLKALQNEEKKTQDKVNAKRVKAKTSKAEKDW